MGTFKSFEDIEAWQEARALTNRIYDASDQLYVALDRGYINSAEFDEMSALATQISRMTSGLMAYLKQSGIKGTKYKQTQAAANLKLEI